MTLPILLTLHHNGVARSKRSARSEEVTALAATVFEARAACWSTVYRLARSPTALVKGARDRIATRMPTRGNRLPPVPRNRADRLEWLRLQDRSGIELERAVRALGDPVAWHQHEDRARAARHSLRVYARARDALVLENMAACRVVASRWCAIYGNAPTATARVAREDLVQDAVIGLMRAIDLFDPRKDCAFSTYSLPWIEQGIRRAVQRHATVRPPFSMRDEHGHLPSSRCMSTDAPANFGTQESTGAKRSALDLLLEDDALAEHADHLDRRHLANLRELYDARVAKLPPRDRYILDRRLEGASLQEIGDEIGVTRERVRQLQAAAMAQLNPKQRKADP